MAKTGLKSNGKLKKGYVFRKGGGVVPAKNKKGRSRCSKAGRKLRSCR